MVANISYALWIVHTSLKGWAESPTTTSIATVAAPAKEAPFPALGVCPAVNDYHNSWVPTSLIFDFLDLLECKEDCNANAVQDFKASFRQFSDKIVDQHFAGEVVNEIRWKNGTLIPGGFNLPEGYKGLENTYPFYLFYCDLAKSFAMKNDTSSAIIAKLMNRLKDAIVNQEEFNLDVLLKEEGIVLKPEGASLLHVLLGKNCSVSSEIQDPERAELAEVNTYISYLYSLVLSFS